MKLYSLKIHNLILHSLLNFKVLYIILFSIYVFASATKLFDYDFTKEQELQFSWLISSIQLVDQWFAGLPFILKLIIFLIPLFAFLAYQLITFILPMLFLYHRLTLTLQDRSLIITRGLFVRRQTVIPLSHIISLSLSQTLLQRFLRLGYIEITSLSHQKAKSSIVYFIARKGALESCLREIMPIPCSFNKSFQPSRMSLLQFLAFPMLIAILIVYLVSLVSLKLFTVPIVLILPLVIFHRSLCYFNTKIAFDDTIVKIKRGGFIKKTTYLYYTKIVAATITQNPAQRVQQLCSLRLHLYGSKRSIRLKNLRI